MSCGDIFVSFPFKPGCCQRPLTPLEQANLRVQIAQLQLALTQKMIGQSVTVTVDQNGERVEFGAGGTVAQLKAYIQTLMSMLPDYCPVGGIGGVARPIGFLFG